MAQQVVGGEQRKQRHAERQRQCDQRRRELQDRREFAPARRDELRGGETGQTDDEQHDDIGQHQAGALDRRCGKVEQDANEGVVAAAIGDGAADERQDRQSQPRGLVGPQKRVPEIHAVKNIGEHEAELAEQGDDDEALGERLDGAYRRMLRRQSEFAGCDLHRRGFDADGKL